MLTSCGSRRATGRRRRGASSTASREHRRGRLGDRRPGELRADPSRLGARGGELARARRCSRQTASASAAGSSNGTIVPAPDASMSCAYQYGVETTAQPAAMRERERARGDLLAVPVRRHEDVGRGEQVGDLVDREEAVVELDVVLEPEVEHRLLERQPVPLALAARDVRMCAPGDHVEHLGMTLDDRRQRLDHRLEPLARRDQPEGREQEPARRRRRRAGARVARAPCGELGARASTRRCAVRHDADLARPGRRLASTSSRRAVSVITITSSASRQSAASTSRLVRRRLRQHRVQRHDERLRQLLARTRATYSPSRAAEDPVLVLEQDDVDVEPAEHPRGADVVAANRLRDRRDAAPAAAGATAR